MCRDCSGSECSQGLAYTYPVVYYVIEAAAYEDAANGYNVAAVSY